MSAQRNGGCLCGSVRFVALGEPMRTLQCHCRFCQRMTGSTSYAESMYAVDAVEFSGEPMSRYSHRSESSSRQVHVHFCPRCGTTITLTFERWPEYRAISRGAFDEPNSVSISSHIWTSSAQTGVVLPAGTDCFEFARADLAGSPQAAARFDAPQMARTDAADPLP
ncbi:GFA family protein [Variovorax sp. DXTD-1]|uniref:GFA family protein n=1 Tax=Variovorax sp. DXTD-1 TaxID=2495592 RepID=UPI000F85F0E6|nr:GFA family protein [Variovorax sp. DXTD-1]RST49523.1 GFA family protein [Variovorax sp. DXTD-1]